MAIETQSATHAESARPLGLALHRPTNPHVIEEHISRAQLLEPGPAARVAWITGEEETRDFLEAIDFHASTGLDREPMVTRLQTHTYTAGTLRFSGWRQCYAMPGWAVVFDAAGEVHRAASTFAKILSPDFSAWPGVECAGDRAWVTDDALLAAVDIPGPHLLLHHPGRQTYGHWLLDCIVNAWVLADEIRAGRLRLLAAPLLPWHRQTLEALDIPLSSVTETSHDLVRCEYLIIPSSLNCSNLLHPPALLGECLRALGRCPKPENELPHAPRIYIGRGLTGERRTMRNEAELVAALEARGFVAVYPRGLSMAQQVHLFGGAECIVGPQGSALVNGAFMSEGRHLVEISSVLGLQNFWIARLCSRLGLRYAMTVVDVADEDREEQVLFGVPRPDADYRFDADIPAVLHALDVFGFH